MHAAPARRQARRDTGRPVAGRLRLHGPQSVRSRRANWIQTHAVAHQRRYQEMQQVLETVRELGLDPLMTAATEAFFERSTSVGLAQAFPEKPASMHAVIEFLEQRLRAL